MSAAIELGGPAPSRAHRIAKLLFDVFLRLLSLVFFALTLQVWSTALGFWPGVQNRFDLMATPLQIYTVVLLVLNPIASVGLWTTLSWGRVVWFAAIGVQIVSFYQFGFGLDDLFGSGLDVGVLLVLFHLGSLAIYILFQLALIFINKKT